MMKPNLFYHLRKLRFSLKLWPFHQNKVNAFLKEWNPSNTDEVLLIGPSAGYSLPLDFIQKFKSITAVEPDPVARFLFERRFKVKPKWIKRPLQFNQIKSLKPFLHFKGPILFCNVLGQVPMKSVAPFKQVLADFLKGKTWASYHDAMSGSGIEFDCEDAPRTKATFTQMKSWIYVKNAHAGNVEVTAHLAPDLFDSKSGLKFQYWWWKLTDQESHLIEGVYQADQKTDQKDSENP